MTEARPKTMPNMPWNIGRLWSGTIGIMISMHPEKMPADAKPAMARPTMKMTEFGAMPQMADPISNITMLIKKVLIDRMVSMVIK
jgi:hypothetical protein